MSEQAGYAVYRLYSLNGELLYVGATKNFRVRMSQHRAEKLWWPLVDERRTAVEWFSTESEAAATEFAAIRAELPIHNIASTGSRKPQMYHAPVGRPGPRAFKRSEGAPAGGPIEQALAEAQNELSALDAEVSRLRGERDATIIRELAGGATWAQIQQVTGLSPRGVQLAIARARAAEGS